MTGADLLVLAPWLLFAAGLAAIGYALLHRCARDRRGPGRRAVRHRHSRR